MKQSERSCRFGAEKIGFMSEWLVLASLRSVLATSLFLGRYPPDYHPISYLYSITYADFSSQIRHSKVVMGKFVFLKGLADLMGKGPLSARAFFDLNLIVRD